MTYVIAANLDAEARWAGITLPKAVLERISRYAVLTAALAPIDELDVEVWIPAELVDPPVVPARIKIGVPPRADLYWAHPDARAVNDRRFAIALTGARVATSLAELDAIVAELPAWVAKAALTAAGRDRHRGNGPLAGEGRVYVERLIARFGAVTIEPWFDRILDAGICADADRTFAPHGILVDTRGGFLGIDLAPPALEDREIAALHDAVDRARALLAAANYRGPFTLDAFAYRADDGTRGFHICELNARYTFGRVAHALHARTGATQLALG